MSLVFALFLGIFYLIGLGILFAGIHLTRLAGKARSWPTVPGVLTSCDIKEHDNEGKLNYEVAVEYSYQVGGVTYTGNTLAQGYDSSGNLDSHEAILAKLQDAEKVDVRYDPRSPQNAALSFGAYRTARFLVIFSITWLAFILNFTLMSVSWNQSWSQVQNGQATCRGCLATGNLLPITIAVLILAIGTSLMIYVSSRQDKAVLNNLVVREKR